MRRAQQVSKVVLLEKGVAGHFEYAGVGGRASPQRRIRVDADAPGPGQRGAERSAPAYPDLHVGRRPDSLMDPPQSTEVSWSWQCLCRLDLMDQLSPEADHF